MPKVVNKNKDRFPTPADVTLRIAGTLVVYKEALVYCMGAVEGNPSKVCLSRINSVTGVFQDNFAVEKHDPDLAFPTADPGFILSEDRKLAYLMRVPIRKQKQGYCSTNVLGVTLNSKSEWGPPYGIEITSRYLTVQLNRNFTLGAWPKYQYAIKESGIARVLSRDLALSEDNKIFLKTVHVGYGEPSSVRLLPEYSTNSLVCTALANEGISCSN